MCFSPIASFATAGLTGVVGIVAMARVSRPRDRLLAAIPIVFSAQQAIEGGLWLSLLRHGPAAAIFTVAFLVVAEIFWPLYAPVAAAVSEPRAWRRRLMLGCLAMGGGVAAYFLWRLLTAPHEAVIVGGCIVYRTGEPHPLLIGLAYLTATALPFVLSSRRAILAFGAVIGVGSVVAYLFYWRAFLSVWCFFAAASSVVILAHFEVARRRRPRPLPA